MPHTDVQITRHTDGKIKNNKKKKRNLREIFFKPVQRGSDFARFAMKTRFQASPPKFCEAKFWRASPKRDQDCQQRKNMRGERFLDEINRREIIPPGISGNLAQKISGVAADGSRADHQHAERVLGVWPQYRLVRHPGYQIGQRAKPEQFERASGVSELAWSDCLLIQIIAGFDSGYFGALA